MEVRPLDGEAGHPGGRDHAAFGTFVFGAFAVPLRPAAGLVAAIGSTRTPWPVKGLAGQFWRTNETRQGSILFRLLAGGERCTSIDRPRSSPDLAPEANGGPWEGRRTELELPPSGLYMPVTRFSEFVNVADLMAMDRTIADVVFKSDLRQHLRLLAGKSFANAQIAGQILSESLSDSLRSIRSRSGK